jgi:hypothetical protein
MPISLRHAIALCLKASPFLAVPLGVALVPRTAAAQTVSQTSANAPTAPIAQPELASPSPAAPIPTRIPRVDLDGSFFADFGHWYNHNTSGGSGVGVETSITMRLGALRLGGFTDVESMFGATSIQGGLLVGPSWTPLPALRLDATGELGGNYVFGIGQDLFVGQTSGQTTAFLPFAGARLSASLRVGREHHGVIGLWGGFREDLTRETRVTTCTSGWGCDRTPQTTTLGGESFLAGLRLGFER